ncbi:treacle protein isoform X1 [Gymnodraco acuticeps]|uniref:Treacle protein isoform X1 n=1 Tax=Gymnodraco acuticeps TaxID=8218 RepID=A0A6P8TVT1_GYMAC|nr:treacle protein isoform X1 [Gymnodraco acuticeps]
MSQAVDRNKVFKTTRVRTSLKNDECWIQRAKQEKKQEELASTDQAVVSRPSPARLSSYVLSTVKRFEAIDSPPSTILQTAPSEGDSANHANGEVIPQKDAQPEGSTVGPTDDAKTQASTEELNVEAQVETSVANTNAENKEENAAENKANVEPINDVAELHFAERIQNDEALTVSSTQGNPEAVSDVKTAEQYVANATAEIKEDQADATIEQPKIELDEPRVATDAPSEDPAAETSAAARTEESKGITEVPEAPVVKLKPEEQPSIETESANVTHLEGGGAKSTAQTAKESCEKGLPEQAAEVVEAVAEDVENEALAEAAVKSPTDGPAVTDAAREESPIQVRVETVPDLVSAQPAAEMATEGSCDKGSRELAAVEVVEVVAEAAVESSPEAAAVTDAAGEESVTQVSVKTVPDLVAESVSEVPAQSAAETEQAAVEVVETVTEVSPSDTSDVVNATPGEVAAVQDIVEAVAEVAVESSPETPAVTIVAGTEAPLQVRVEQVPDVVADTVSESPTKAETAVKSVECEVKSAPSAETVLESKAEQVAEVQTVDNTVVEQIVEPTPEKAADLVTQLNIEDALLEPVPALEDVQDKSTDSPVEQSKALDVEHPQN